VTLPVASFVTLPLMAGSCAMAQGADPIHQAAESQPFIGLLFMIALAGIATATTLAHLAGRKAWGRREATLVGALAAARADLHRANVFLSAEPQILVAWGAAADEPDIAGDLSLIGGVLTPRQALAFGSWLGPDAAQALERAVERLRGRGEGFRLPLTSLAGRHFEADGRAVGGRAVLRIRDVSGDRLELTRLRESDAGARAELESLRNLLDALPSPSWTRDGAGRLTWANAAYARAVEAANGKDAVARQLELLESHDRETAAGARAAQAGLGSAPKTA
jgi:PAS domain-containing protein